jgi:hypothetical protein
MTVNLIKNGNGLQDDCTRRISPSFEGVSGEVSHPWIFVFWWPSDGELTNSALHVIGVADLRILFTFPYYLIRGRRQNCTEIGWGVLWV